MCHSEALRNIHSFLQSLASAQVAYQEFAAAQSEAASAPSAPHGPAASRELPVVVYQECTDGQHHHFVQ